MGVKLKQGAMCPLCVLSVVYWHSLRCLIALYGVAISGNGRSKTLRKLRGKRGEFGVCRWTTGSKCWYVGVKLEEGATPPPPVLQRLFVDSLYIVYKAHAMGWYILPSFGYEVRRERTSTLAFLRTMFRV